MDPSIGAAWFGVDLRTYQIVRWLYFVVAAALTVALARSRGVPPRTTLLAFAIGIPGGLLGGHLLNVFEAWPFYRQNPRLILDVLAGGSSIYGAFIGGLTAGIAYLRLARIPIRSFLDAASPAMALGESMTRIGCFLNGCCFGRPTLGPLGVSFPRESQVFAAQLSSGLLTPAAATTIPTHPTQLYSAFLAFLLFSGLLLLFRRNRSFPGALFCVFVFGYALIRLLLGYWRADTGLYWWEASRLISVLAIAASIALWRVWRSVRSAAASRFASEAGSESPSV